MSSLAYMMVRAFFRLWGVWLAASTWTCIPQLEFTTAPARRSARTTAWSFLISLYSSTGEFISTWYRCRVEPLALSSPPGRVGTMLAS